VALAATRTGAALPHPVGERKEQVLHGMRLENEAAIKIDRVSESDALT
jgi:hypothetical protein